MVQMPPLDRTDMGCIKKARTATIRHRAASMRILDDVRWSTFHQPVLPTRRIATCVFQIRGSQKPSYPP